MASHAGKDGIVKVGASPAVVAEVREWTLESSSDITDSSSMSVLQGNSGWATNVATIKRWSGSLTCWWDETDTNGQVTLEPGVELAIKVYPEGADTGDTFYSGTAIIATVNRQAAMDGMVEAEFSFTGTGALTKSTAS
jgi:hypothetical protein